MEKKTIKIRFLIAILAVLGFASAFITSCDPPKMYGPAPSDFEKKEAVKNQTKVQTQELTSDTLESDSNPELTSDTLETDSNPEHK